MLSPVCNHDHLAVLLTEFLNALLTSDRLTGALAGPGIGTGALAAYRQGPAMAVTAVAADFAQTVDVLLNLTTQGTFDENRVLIEDGDDLGDLIFGELFGALLRVDARFLEDLLGVGPTHTVEIGQRNPEGLVVGNVDTADTRHSTLLRRGLDLTHVQSGI